MESDKSYERRRVVQSIFLLLKYVVDYVKFTVSLPAAHGAGRAKGGRAREPRNARPLCHPLTLTVRIH